MEQRRIEIPVMHCFDNNYVIPAAVSFYSMLEHADRAYDYRLFVLHSDITVQNQNKLRKLVEQFGNARLEFMDMNHRFEDLWGKIANSDHLSKEMIYKLIASEMFPEYDKIVITDVDVAFLGDIAPSYFALDQKPDAYFAGVRQINPNGTFLRDYYTNNYLKAFGEIEYNQLKICAGYLVANLKKQREDGISSAFVDYLSEHSGRLLQPEQDAINFCCKERQIEYLPLSYVVCSYMYDVCKTDAACCSDPFYTYREMKDAMEHPIQLHYATKTKPWNTPDSTKAEIWFEYLKKTEFYEDYLNKKASEKQKTQTPLPEKDFFAHKEPKIKVSVLCAAYNHERFIGKALDGILNQKTSFDYEVIVADDASTDQTQEIIRQYQEKYPEKMEKCILREKNVGIGENYFEALSRVEGEYLAICDGDDCWIDEHKLQKQVDFLDAHPEYAIVCSDFLKKNVDRNISEEERFSVSAYLKEFGLPTDRLSMDDYNACRFIASCTEMLRWRLNGCVPEFLKAYKVIDLPLNLIHSATGYIHVMDEAMAEYHVHGEGIMTQEPDTLLKQNEMMLSEIEQYFHYKVKLRQRSKADGAASSEMKRIVSLLDKEGKLAGFMSGIKRKYHALIPLKIRNRIYSVLHK